MPSDLDDSDLDLMARTMIGEESTPEGRAAVGNVILNRMRSGDYPDSVSGVIYQPNAFESWSTRGRQLSAIPTSSKDYQAAYAIAQKLAAGKLPDETKGSVNFLNSTLQRALGRQIPTWAQGQPTAMIGKQQYFGGNQAPSNDFLTDFDVAPSNGTPASKATATPAADGPAFERDFEVAPRGRAPIRVIITKDEPADVNDSSRTTGIPAVDGMLNPSFSEDNQTVRALATGIPIVGGLLNKADAATNALLAPVLNPLFAKENQLQGDTWSDRYHNALRQQEGKDTAFAQEHPIADNVLRAAGGVAGTAPMMVAAPELFGLGKGDFVVNSLMSAASGAGINAADTAVRGGDMQDIGRNALIGTAFGAAGPAVGKGIGMALGKVTNALTGTTPAARKVANILQNIGMSPPEAEAALKRAGPEATLADIDPALTTQAAGLARMGGAPTSILKGAMLQRAAQSDDRMAQAVDQYLGPKPDTDAILSDIRDREGDLSYDSKIARSSLDEIMGKSSDPYQVLQSTMKQRSADAQPLYEKALARPVAWDDRLQQFLDDPIVQSGLAKGVRIQRLESLADNTPFRPNDYAIKDFDEAGNPIIGDTPNMRTLNVVKKGLDALVDDAKDPVTGHLSEEGRAVDKVRGAFLQKLDDINPDYKAARQAWAGPSQAQDAFNRGLNVFQNRTGSSGINSTPQALSSWFNGASKAEQDAVKIGARAAFEQQMQAASDPASKAAALVNKEANQAKLTALFGKDQADKLVRQLNFKYEDPVGQAFDRGLNVFKARQGSEGIQDTPDQWGKMLQSASPGEFEAYRQGARQAIEQALTSARQGDVSAARSLFAKSTVNRQKLEMLFPEAKQLFDRLDSELQMRAVEQRVAHNSATAESQAVQQEYTPQQTHPIDSGMAVLGNAIDGGSGAALLTGGKMLYGGLRNALTSRALARLTEGMAHGLVATGPEQQAFLRQVGRAGRTSAVNNALTSRGEFAGNLLTRSVANDRPRRVLIELP